MLKRAEVVGKVKGNRSFGFQGRNAVTAHLEPGKDTAAETNASSDSEGRQKTDSLK